MHRFLQVAARIFQERDDHHHVSGPAKNHDHAGKGCYGGSDHGYYFRVCKSDHSCCTIASSKKSVTRSATFSAGPGKRENLPGRILLQVKLLFGFPYPVYWQRKRFSDWLMVSKLHARIYFFNNFEMNVWPPFPVMIKI